MVVLYVPMFVDLFLRKNKASIQNGLSELVYNLLHKKLHFDENSKVNCRSEKFFSGSFFVCSSLWLFASGPIAGRLPFVFAFFLDLYGVNI